MRVFASHDWGMQSANHARVAEVVAALRGHGFTVWFDETDLRGNVLDAMCRGIDESDVVLVFVTKNYMRKVASGNDCDNVRREFMHASAHPDKMVPIKFEDDLPTPWTGPVGMLLGARLYVDVPGPSSVDALVDVLRERERTVEARRRTARAFASALRSNVRVREAPRLSAASPSAPSPSAHRVPPPLVPHRRRVARILAAMGETADEREHIGNVVDRLLVSIVGSDVTVNAPLVDKMKRLERELGLVPN